MWVKMLSLRRTLAKFNSPISGKIEVVQEGKERRLMVGGLAQSINYDAPDVGERIWGVLAQTQISNLKIQNSLILGLGGGTVAHLLTKKFGPIPIDAIELDPMMVEIGKKFFDLNELKNLNVVVADAVSVVANPAAYPLNPLPYTLILVDLYCGSKYPTKAESPTFFAALKRLTHPKGLLVFNRLSSKTNAGFEEKLKQSFGDFKKKTIPSKSGGHNITYTI